MALVKDLLHSLRDSEWLNFLRTIDYSAKGWSKIYKLNKRLLRKPPPEDPIIDSQGKLQFKAK